MRPKIHQKINVTGGSANSAKSQLKADRGWPARLTSTLGIVRMLTIQLKLQPHVKISAQFKFDLGVVPTRVLVLVADTIVNTSVKSHAFFVQEALLSFLREDSKRLSCFIAPRMVWMNWPAFFWVSVLVCIKGIKDVLFALSILPKAALC